MTPAEKKRRAEEEARRAAFAQRGKQPPPSTDISTLLGPEGRALLDQEPAAPAAAAEPASASAPPAAQEAPQEPAEGAPAAPAQEPAQEPPQAAQEPAAAPTAPEPPKAAPKARKTAPAPAKAADWQQAEPWASAHPKVMVPFMLRLPEGMHMQLTFLKERMPNTSLQKIAHEAIRDKIAELMEEYYK
jgi:hypothetical protein